MAENEEIRVDEVSRSLSGSARRRDRSSSQQSLKRLWRKSESSEPVEVISIPRIVKAQHSLQQSLASASPERPNSTGNSLSQTQKTEKLSPLLLSRIKQRQGAVDKNRAAIQDSSLSVVASDDLGKHGAQGSSRLQQIKLEKSKQKLRRGKSGTSPDN